MDTNKQINEKIGFSVIAIVFMLLVILNTVFINKNVSKIDINQLKKGDYITIYETNKKLKEIILVTDNIVAKKILLIKNLKNNYKLNVSYETFKKMFSSCEMKKNEEMSLSFFIKNIIN